MKHLNCIVCSKELKNVHFSNHVQPYDGLLFISRGHYGSGIFDPMSSDLLLEVVICDECILKNLDKVHGSGKKELEEDLKTYTESIHEVEN